jgi:hypothetical protein
VGGLLRRSRAHYGDSEAAKRPESGLNRCVVYRLSGPGRSIPRSARGPRAAGPSCRDPQATKPAPGRRASRHGAAGQHLTSCEPTSRRESDARPLPGAGTPPIPYQRANRRTAGGRGGERARRTDSITLADLGGRQYASCSGSASSAARAWATAQSFARPPSVSPRPCHDEIWGSSMEALESV